MKRFLVNLSAAGLFLAMMMGIGMMAGVVSRAYGDSNGNVIGPNIIAMPSCSTTVTCTLKTLFNVSKYYQSQICMLVDDTSSTGYASDSINGIWKIQFGWSMPSSAGVNDTMWLPSATVDSIITAKFGTVTASTLDSLGNFIPRLRCVDTLSVSGYAIAYGPVLTNQPYRWARVIWSGHAGNKVGRKILLKACQFIHPTSRVSNYPAWGW